MTKLKKQQFYVLRPLLKIHLRRPLPTTSFELVQSLARVVTKLKINTPGSPESMKRNETRYIHSRRISPFMRVGWPHPQGEKAAER